ncbi:aldehyde dehydrogenase (NADP(+)) [Pararhizobium sp. DWP3-4]|uniref:aldehyde dehydrogenase (NADP(+)) n=1 Tax=unclassified Pararhizobium TaxID=2643050 RepID=UPI003CE97707
MTTEVTGEILIGQSTMTGQGKPMHAVNPSTGARLQPPFSMASAADVNRACQLADAAFNAYRALDLEARAVFLETIAANIADLGSSLIDRAIAETGLPAFRLEGEFDRTVKQLRLFAWVVRDGEWLDLRVDPAMPNRKPLPRPDIRLRQIPLGPVAVFGSSNFPLAFSVAGGDTTAALAAGCPVVVKGHLAHPGTGEMVGRAIQAAVTSCGLPEGVFSLVTGPNETGAALVRHPAMKAVGFTGSRIGGLALQAIAAARAEPIPVYAEMSSVNPVFLLRQALASRAEEMATAFVASFTVGAGQLCTNPGLLIAIDGQDVNRFTGAAATSLKENDAGPMLSAGIHDAFLNGVARLAGHTGVSTVARGRDSDGVNRTAAAFFETTASQFCADPSLAEEVFGASALLVRCADFSDVLAVANALEGQLTATLHLDDGDLEDASELLPILERKVGRILANGWPTGVEVSDAMVHGGPFPATSDSRTTSVGTMSIRRFLRPVSYQNLPAGLLPQELRPGIVGSMPHLLDGKRA